MTTHLWLFTPLLAKLLLFCLYWSFPFPKEGVESLSFYRSQFTPSCILGGLPRWLSGKESRDVGDAGLIPGSGRSPGGGNGNPLQYSHLKNSMDRGAWWATVQGVTKMTEHNT